MKINVKKIAVLALVLGVVAGMAAPAMGALSYDNETTDSPSTSDLVGGETVTDLDNESKAKTIQVISGNASSSSLTNPEEAFKVELSVDDADNEHENYTFYTNTSTFTVVNASAGHYSINLTHAEMFAEMPRQIDENVSVDVTVTFNESESDEESSTISINAQNGDDRSVNVVTDSDVEDEDGVETVNESRTLRDDLDYVTVDGTDEINNNTTVTYVFANETVENKYQNAYDVGSFSSGDYIFTMTATVERLPVMVFDSSAGDERDAGVFSGGFDPSSDSYAVYYNNGGEHGEHARLDVVPQGDHADADYLDVETDGNKKMGFFANLKNFGTDAARSSGVGIAP